MPTIEDHVDLSPDQVHEHLQRHILADGFDLVLDLDQSRGALLRDRISGRDFLDFFTCFSTMALGYNHPALRSPETRDQLLAAAINKPSNSDLYTAQMASFVEAFARTVPESHNSHLFFVEGGALAVENAMKAAFDWKHRKNDRAGRGHSLGNKILHFREAFHGRSGYTLSVTNTDPAKTKYFPKFDWPRVTNPKLRFPITETVLAEVEQLEEQALAEIRQAFREHPHDIAGLLIEPIQGEGGDNHFRKEFLSSLRDLADEEEALLLFDEVQTGFGTTGRWWCFEHFDVVPDIFAFGKKTQVCGIAAGPRLDQVDSVFEISSRINSTWGGNLVDMIRCQIIIEVIEQEDLLNHVSRIGALLLEGIEELTRQFPETVTNPRGRGFFTAFDLPDGAVRDRALEAMKHQDLLALSSGPSSVRFRPPLVLDQALAEDGLRRVERALASVL